MRPVVRLRDTLASAPLSLALAISHQTHFTWLGYTGTSLSDMICTSPLMTVILSMFWRDEIYANGDDPKNTSFLIKPTSNTRFITCRCLMSRRPAPQRVQYTTSNLKHCFYARLANQKKSTKNTTTRKISSRVHLFYNKTTNPSCFRSITVHEILYELDKWFNR